MKRLPTNKVFKSWAYVLSLSLLALLLQISLDKLVGSHEWIFFYPAIFITTWFCGSRYGYAATFICCLLASFFLNQPLYSFKLENFSSVLEISILAFMGISTSFMMGKIYSSYINASTHSEELEKSTQYLDLLLENIPLMVFVKDARDLKFIRFNKAGEELLGFPREELIGKSDYDFFPKAQADFFISKDLDVIAGRKVVDIDVEYIQTKNLGIRTLHTKKIPLYGNDGKPQYLLGVSEDITEKKRNEEDILRMIKEEVTVKEREIAAAREAFLAKVSTLLSSSLDYHETLTLLADLSVTALGDWCTISILNDEGKFERAAGAHLDKTKTPLINEYIKNYPPDTRMFTILSDKSYINPQILESQLQSMIKDQRQAELLEIFGANSSMIVPIKSRGKIRGTIAFIAGKSKPNFNNQDLALAEDLGRRAGVAIENALLYSSSQSAIKARDEFVSIASHELKTPITSLKMQLQMMLRSVSVEKNIMPTPEKLIKTLVNSSHQIDRLTVLIEDLLDVTRIETGKLTYKFEEVNFSKLVKEVAERFSEEIKMAKCTLTENIKDDVMTFCDRYRIEQVIANLISNAIKYGSNGPVTISVIEKGGKAQVIIEDLGMGIAKEMQGKIFERFERAISSTNISGLGLGLYITKQIVDAHQGSIEVQSELGKGSTFKISLPTGV